MKLAHISFLHIKQSNNNYSLLKKIKYLKNLPNTITMYVGDELQRK